MTTFYDMLVLNLQRFPENMKVNFRFGNSTLLYSDYRKKDEDYCGYESWVRQVRHCNKLMLDSYVDVSYNDKGTRLVYNLKNQLLEVIDSKDVMTVGELIDNLEGIFKSNLLDLSIDYDNYDALTKLPKEVKNSFDIKDEQLDYNLHDNYGSYPLNTKLEDLKEDEYFFTLEVSNPNLLTIDFKVYSSF